MSTWSKWNRINDIENDEHLGNTTWNLPPPNSGKLYNIFGRQNKRFSAH